MVTHNKWVVLLLNRLTIVKVVDIIRTEEEVEDQLMPVNLALVRLAQEQLLLGN